MAKKNEISPMMKQYFEMKEQYPDVLLFYRVGDFYEMFYEDAKTASKELDLVLTGRANGGEEKAPMCGVPFHSVEPYIAKLVSRGYKVAICEQVEDPKQAKGIVKRDVIRIITPGTVIDGNMLEDGKNNYLSTICETENEIGICFTDISTGEFHITNIDDKSSEKVLNQLSTYSPSEILASKDAYNIEGLVKFAERINARLSCEEDWFFDFKDCTQIVIETLGGDKIRELGIEKSESAIGALGAAISYLKETQKTDTLEKPSEIDFYDDSKFMKLDISARRNLELTQSMMTGDKRHSLLWVIDSTRTAMGKRMLRSWIERPLMSLPAITRRQNAVAELFDNTQLREEIRDTLTGINDVERLMSRIAYKTVNAKELRRLSQTIEHFPIIKGLISSNKSALIKSVYASIDVLSDVKELIDVAIAEEPPFSLREGGIIKDGYNEEIDSLREIMNNGAGILASIEQEQRELTGIPKLKVGYNKVFGYFIEVTNSYKDMVPDSYVRKQTLTNAERYITQELKELEGKVLGAKERSISLEYEIFCTVRDTIAAEVDRIQQTAKAIAYLDCVASLADVAVKNRYCCPQITNDGELRIVEGRHPVIEALLEDVPFVPNDTHLDDKENRCLVITGPNMAGKSTYMRQTALITLLAQIGSFVPAKSANVSIVDAIFTRVGASDDLATGQSTFMVEMNEISTILKNATKDSLIILDEIGRGTSTFDGMSIARAVLEFVVNKKTLGAKTLFATHYHELTVLEDMLDGVKNYSIAVKKRGDDITFLRRIVKGGADQSFGIEVAKLAGVPDKVIRRAKAVLNELESQKVDITFSTEEVEIDDSSDIQYNFSTGSKDQLVELLKAVDINTMTPMEALQTLNDLKKKAEEV